MNDVTVIGAGIAGSAAALALADELGSRAESITIVVGPAGASQLAPGVFDGDDDGDGDGSAARLLTQLGAFALGDCAVATLAGIVRRGKGRDRALLDLATAHGEVLVPRSTRHGWDADGLVQTLADSAFAKKRGLSFRAFDASIVRYADERFIPDGAMAARHDDDDRITWLADRLRLALATADAGSNASAVLLPPWLGASRERATSLSAALGRPCGEIAVGLAGPAGFRFSAARDRALATAAVVARPGFVARIDTRDSSVAIELESGERWESRVCVLATGGLIGGGLRYDPSEATESAEYPITARPYVRASLGDPPVGVHGRLLGAPGSLFGVAPEAIAWPFVDDGDLERVGVLVEDSGRVTGSARLFACGELIADRRRTWFDSVRSGLTAARTAALTLSADAEGRAKSSG